MSMRINPADIKWISERLGQPSASTSTEEFDQRFTAIQDTIQRGYSREVGKALEQLSATLISLPKSDLKGNVKRIKRLARLILESKNIPVQERMKMSVNLFGRSDISKILQSAVSSETLIRTFKEACSAGKADVIHNLVGKIPKDTLIEVFGMTCDSPNNEAILPILIPHVPAAAIKAKFRGACETQRTSTVIALQKEVPDDYQRKFYIRNVAG